MKKIICALIALMLLVSACAEGAYHLGPFTFETDCVLNEVDFASMSGESATVEHSCLPALGLPRSFADTMDADLLRRLVQEMDKTYYEDVETFELENGVYGAVYTEGETRVGHFVQGLDMLYVRGDETVIEDVRASIGFDETLRVQPVLSVGSFNITLPDGWLLCARAEKRMEFAPLTGSVGATLMSEEQSGVKWNDGAPDFTALIEKTEDAETFQTPSGMTALRGWRQVSENSRVLTVFVPAETGVLALVFSNSEGEEAMNRLAEELLKNLEG